MATYCESLGLAPIDWKAKLNSGEDKELSNNEWVALFPYIGWTHCPCGNLDVRIPRDGFHSRVLDLDLRKLGYAFAGAITSMDRSKALDLIERIEKRGAEILKTLETPT